MHIYFRTDGNEIIATGHVMRCLSVADACNEMGHEVTFITADNQCSELIHQRGYDSINLLGKWNDLEYELCKLMSLISKHAISILIIDSYYVTEEYLRKLRGLTKTVYFDDLNAFDYPVNVLINYSIYAKRFVCPSHYLDTKLLLGCDYVPLRMQFKNIGKKEIHKQVQNILITTGGTDNQKMIGELLNVFLNDVFFEHISIHVIMGVFYSNVEELRVLERQSDNITIHCNVVDMAELMVKADVAISAGGSTLYELSACGVPTVVYSIADNQLDNASGFAERGLMEYVGDVRNGIEGCIENIVKATKQYMQCSEKRTMMSHDLQQLVDGLGGMRIVYALTRE